MEGRSFADSGGSVLLDAIEDQVAEERSRKDSIERRATWVGAAAGGLIAAIVALAARGAVSATTKVLLIEAAFAFLAALAFVGLAIRPFGYHEPSLDALRVLVDGEEWGQDVFIVSKDMAATYLSTLQSARSANDRKTKALSRGMLAGAGAVTLLVFATVVAFAHSSTSSTAASLGSASPPAAGAAPRTTTLDLVRNLVPVGTALIGTALGYLLSIRGKCDDRLHDMKVASVTEFLALAYTNLRYIVAPTRAGSAGPGDFSVAGERAALFVKPDLASQIDDYTTEFARVTHKLAESGSDPDNEFGRLKASLDSLRDFLRADIRLT